MNKNQASLLLIAVLIPVAVKPVLAKTDNSTQIGSSTSEDHPPQTTQITTTGQNVRVENELKIETKNQGESQQLKVNTQEQEQTDVGTQNQSASSSSNPKSQVTAQHMSEVAKQVDILLSSPDRKGGIGEEVRQIAQQQSQAQATISGKLKKLDERGDFIKTLFGPDYKAIKNLQQLMAQNQLRIQQLEQLQAQITNTADATKIQKAIDALIQQNTSLQSRVSAEQDAHSLFGWLFKLFS